MSTNVASPTRWARRSLALLAALPLAAALAGTPQAQATPDGSRYANNGRSTVTVPLNKTLLFTHDSVAPFTLRLQSFKDADVPMRHNNDRPRGVWVSFQWVQMAGYGPGLGTKQPRGSFYTVTSVNSGTGESVLPGYQFPLYLSSSPYNPRGEVYTAAVQPGLVLVLEKLPRWRSNPTATLTIAQYRGSFPCMVGRFAFEKRKRVELTLGPVGPVQVDVGQRAGSLQIRGSHGRGGPLGLDVLIRENIRGEECTAGFNPTLFKGDVAYLNGVGKVAVTRIKDYPPRDPRLLGVPVGEARITLEPWR